MPFLNRLFQSRRTRNNSGKGSSDGRENQWIPPEFDKSRIRLVVYADSDLRGRQLLFDSKTFQRLEEDLILNRRCSKETELTPVQEAPLVNMESNSLKYQYQRTGSDVEMLEEMIFGSVAMAYKGASLKVHSIRSPQQLMLTKVFVPDYPKRESGSELDCDSCSLRTGDSSLRINSLCDRNRNTAHSLPVDMPRNYDHVEEDSGLASITSSGSFSTPFPSPGSSTASSYNSLHRRWMRSQRTSLEGGGRKGSQETVGQDSSLPRSRRNKLGVAVLFDLWSDEPKNNLFQNFFYSHIPLFEGHLEKLCVVINQAFNTKRIFEPTVMEGLEVFCGDFFDLYTAPRLSEPMWLNMMSHTNYKYVLCDKFMLEFTSLVVKYDNKNTHFFISTLISAILTYHLAWVPTVTPTGGATSKLYMEKHSAKWPNALAKCHPYNPLWAQLGDLYGAIGHPLKLARTIITGKKKDLVMKMLCIVSYFIRCSEVHENMDIGSVTEALEAISFDDSTSECHRTLSDIISMDRDSVSDIVLMSEDHCEQQIFGASQCGVGFSSDEEEADVCNLSTAPVVESCQIENVQHVLRAPNEISQDVVLELLSSQGGDVTGSQTRRGRSKLSEQLAQQDSKDQGSAVITKNSIRKIFLKEGSNSMFDEYFEENIETRTIDNVKGTDQNTLLVLDCENAKLNPSNSVISNVSGSGHCVEGEKCSRSVTDGQMSLAMKQISCDKGTLSQSISKSGKSLARSVSNVSDASRARHLSSASTCKNDVELIDPLLTCQESPMPKCNTQGSRKLIKNFENNFGHSLLAGFSDHYLSDFVLHGTSSTQFHRKLAKDLQMSVQHSVLDEPISEAVCIVADTDKWTVCTASSHQLDKSPMGTIPFVASHLVCDMIESVHDLWKLKMSPEFCLMHLEDRLQEIYFKSMMLVEYVQGTNSANMKELTTMLGFDDSDVSLLMAIASTHSSQALNDV